MKNKKRERRRNRELDILKSSNKSRKENLLDLKIKKNKKKKVR